LLRDSSRRSSFPSTMAGRFPKYFEFCRGPSFPRPTRDPGPGTAPFHEIASRRRGEGEIPLQVAVFFSLSDKDFPPLSPWRTFEEDLLLKEEEIGRPRCWRFPPHSVKNFSFLPLDHDRRRAPERGRRRLQFKQRPPTPQNP